MLKSILSGVVVAGVAMCGMQDEAYAGKSHHHGFKGHHSGFDVLDFIEIEHDFDDDDDGPSCAWIRKMAKKTHSAYWKNRYREDCLDD